MRHQGLRPYVGHRDELALIGSFDQAHVLESASTFAATLPPGSLHSDIILLRDWAEDMAGPGGQRSSLTSGLLQFNLEVLRSTLLPITCKAYAGYMSKIASSLTSSIKELREQVEKYIVMLRRRPSDLDSFVEFIEETYQHLDDNGDLRLAVITSKEQISSLYEVLRAAVPQVPSTFDDRSPSAGRLKQTQSLPLSIHVNETHHANQQQGAAAMSSLSAATGGMIGPGGAILVTNVTARDARPVFQQWKQAQSDINRYHDECLAAREFFESSSALMASHLKADLAEMETEASHILNDLRMGRSTSSQLSPTEAQFELIRLDENLSSLKTHLARFHAWMKLLGNQPGVKTILLETEEMVLCAATHLESRTSFWRAVAEWEHVLDRLHSKRCFGKGPQADLSSDNDSEEENRSAKRWFGPLVDQLESKMIALDKVVTEISLKHVDADVKNTMTATPPESSLAARFAVVVKSYKSMLPYAKALSQPG